MKTQHVLAFGTCRLDPANEQLWCGAHLASLKPKTFAVLRYLVEHAGQLVTKEALLDSLWAGVHVSDAVLKTCIREIRQALQDSPQEPQYIETVHRRGYRFIAPLTIPPPVSGSRLLVSGPTNEQRETSNEKLETRLVGRDAELAQLHRWLEKALHGERQMIFVTGEAGIGKTTLVEAWLDRLARTEAVWIARGQCIEHYGPGEAYLPVLEALGRLGQEDGGIRLVPVLQRFAPTWLAQLPALVEAEARETWRGNAQGATTERMLREMADALEACSRERPVVLRIEDLHWSDPSTLDLLSYVARRPGSARLLLLGTYRPADVLMHGHPLKLTKHELEVHGQCVELPLEGLSSAAVAEYLTRRFSPRTPQALSIQHAAHVIHHRTEGIPLFMVAVVNALVAQGVFTEHEHEWVMVGNLKEADIPSGVRQFIEQQIDRLSVEAQTVLETASVAGVEFSVTTVAASLDVAVDDVERTCETLAKRGQFLQRCGVQEWPDGAVSARYRFMHALYQEVVYHRVSEGRRVNLHRRIGEREEAAYGFRAREIAAELALHFERGRDYDRVVQYLQYAGENAIQRHAPREAVELLSKGLRILQAHIPDADPHRELTLLIALGGPLAAIKGYAAPEVEHTYTRARALCQHAPETPELFRILLGLYGFYLVRAELSIAREIGALCLALAERAQDSSLRMLAHGTLANPLFFLGEFREACGHLQQGVALYDVQQHSKYALIYGNDPGVARLSYAAWTLWFLGYPEQAVQSSQSALHLARTLGHPFTLAFALGFAAWLHLVRRGAPQVREYAESLLVLAEEHGFPFWLIQGVFLHGWAITEQGQQSEGLAQLQHGEASYRTMGAKVGRSQYLAVLAESCGKAGKISEADDWLREGLATVDAGEEKYFSAELWRIKGELLLAQQRQRQTAKRRGQRSTTAKH